MTRETTLSDQPSTRVKLSPWGGGGGGLCHQGRSRDVFTVRHSFSNRVVCLVVLWSPDVFRQFCAVCVVPVPK